MHPSLVYQEIMKNIGEISLAGWSNQLKVVTSYSHCVQLPLWSNAGLLLFCNMGYFCLNTVVFVVLCLLCSNTHFTKTSHGNSFLVKLLKLKERFTTVSNQYDFVQVVPLYQLCPRRRIIYCTRLWCQSSIILYLQHQ